MNDIVKAEMREVKEAKKKRQEGGGGSQRSEVTIEDNTDNFDDLVSWQRRLSIAFQIILFNYY
jgi:hypothetical protein